MGRKSNQQRNLKQYQQTNDNDEYEEEEEEATNYTLEFLEIINKLHNNLLRFSRNSCSRIFDSHWKKTSKLLLYRNCFQCYSISYQKIS